MQSTIHFLAEIPSALAMPEMAVLFLIQSVLNVLGRRHYTRSQSVERKGVVCQKSRDAALGLVGERFQIEDCRWLNYIPGARLVTFSGRSRGYVFDLADMLSCDTCEECFGADYYQEMMPGRLYA